MRHESWRPDRDFWPRALVAARTAALFFLGGNPVLIFLGVGLAGVVVVRGPPPRAPSEPGSRSGWRALLPPRVALAFAAGLVVVLFEPWFSRFRSSPIFQRAVLRLALSFVGLLGAVTIQFARVASWSVPSTMIAGVALIARLVEIAMLWVVLGGAAVSVVVL